MEYLVSCLSFQSEQSTDNLLTYVNLENNSTFQPDQTLDFYLNTSLSGENLFCKQEICDTMGHIALPVGQGTGGKVSQPVSDVSQKSHKEKLSVLGLPDHLPFPERFPIGVEKAIRDGNVLSARNQLIADISTFFYGLLPTHSKEISKEKRY